MTTQTHEMPQVIENEDRPPQFTAELKAIGAKSPKDRNKEEIAIWQDYSNEKSRFDNRQRGQKMRGFNRHFAKILEGKNGKPDNGAVLGHIILQAVSRGIDRKEISEDASGNTGREIVDVVENQLRPNANDLEAAVQWVKESYDFLEDAAETQLAVTAAAIMGLRTTKKGNIDAILQGCLTAVNAKD